ncbi:cache domain-containing sensor histidine kinase [Paenibacillus methanolicus]|uniref:Two-component system sensor histidine kinase YesM n=1 Tax=Paenibacillus methanolicus TaxID=582686 RepID=A0A5S5C021_9BACL|nr:sensor histidine kinase [Paenibacillus methanolicus]TYP71968.1 two-component system sensor histidine kinase YesM [Paenibacillus methanolicus]
MRPFIRQSIFSKLLVSFLLLSIIPLMLAGWFVLTNSESTLDEKLNRETTNVLDQKLKTLSFFIADVGRMGDAIAADPNVTSYLGAATAAQGQAFLPEIDRMLAAAKAIRPENVGMTLIGDNGLVHAYGYAPRLQGAASADFAWLPPADQLAQPYMISMAHERTYSQAEPDELVFSYLERIGGQTGGTSAGAAGTLVIDFKLEVLRDLLKNIFLLGDIYNDYASGVIVTDQAGQMLYPYAAGSFAPEDFERMREHYFLIQRYDGTTDWHFTAYFLKSELYKPIYKVRQAAFTIALISVAFCLLASLLLSNVIAKPITALRRMMRQVGRGDFDVRYQGKSSDEIGALGHGFNTMVGRIQDLMGQVYDEQEQKRRAEITAMQSQINPHFLYNTLESINSLARKSKQTEISRMIVLLGRLLRMSIGSFDDMIPLDKEIAYLRNYLEIHALRMKEGFRYDIRLADGMERLYTIKWILQPVIENAVIHGLGAEQRGGAIDIRGWCEGEDVYIRVTDQGAGMAEDAAMKLSDDLEHRALELTKHHGKVGLFNVQSRIRLHFGAPYGIRIEPAAEGFSVLFRLPRRERP